MNKYAKNLLIGGNIWYLGEGMLGPLFAVFSERVGGDVLDVSYAWALYLVISGILTIVVGRVADKFKCNEQLLVSGYFLNAAGTFAYLLVNNQTKLLFVQAVLGIASALASPTWDALFSKHENRKNGGLLWGLAGGSAEILTGIALVVGGILVTRFSFSTLFIVMGAVQLTAAVYQSKILRMR
jgi:MFS family permease